MISRLLTIGLMVGSWLLLAAGARELWGAAGGFLALGGCIWVDLYLGDRLRGPE